jgi:hypothetical protein
VLFLTKEVDINSILNRVLNLSRIDWLSKLPF